MASRLQRMIPPWVRSRSGRVVLSVMTVAVIVAVAVTAGLVAGTNGPADEAAPEDTYATAPGCDTVPDSVVASAVPGAVLDAGERGALAAADGATCVWTSVDSEDDAPRMLHVDFTANFTDPSEDVSGTAIATEQVDRLRSAGGGRVPTLGEDALAREATPEGGAAEVVFVLDNLVVRVLYGGDEDTGGEDLSYDDARDGAITVAERIAEEL